MAVTEIEHQERLQEWKNKIVERRSNGGDVKQWCEGNGAVF